MTAPTTTPSDPSPEELGQAGFYMRLHRFHGHRCPMSILGARLGLAVAARLGRHGQQGDVKAIYHHRTCALDGIQAALGTTLGNNNLHIVEEQKHQVSARNERTGRTVIVQLTETALSRGRAYSEMRKKGGMEAEMAALLTELEQVPEQRLVEVVAER